MQLELDFAEVVERRSGSVPQGPVQGGEAIPVTTDVVATGVVGKGKKSSRLEKRFDKLWRQLEEKQSRNDSFDSDYEQVCAWMHTELAESRSLYKNELVLQTEKLIGHMAKKSLSKWQREEIGLWVEENFNLLEIHGASELPLLARKYFEARMAALSADERSYLEEVMDLASLDDDESPGEDDDGFDPEDFDIEDFDDEDFNEEGGPDTHSDGARHGEPDSRNSYYEDMQANDRKIKRQTFDKSLVSKLFRRTAKALHPDHEQDPEIRDQKQSLMKNLLEARKTGNIAVIFSLYREHVDSATIEIDLPELQPMVDLLVQQISELDEVYFQKTDQSPLHDWVRRHITGKPEKRRLATLGELKLDLERDIKRTRNLHPHLASLAKLKPVLEERYEEHNFSYF